MSVEPFQKSPYLDWNLDRWKISVILLLFLVLLFVSLFRRSNALEAERVVVNSLAAPAAAQSSAAPAVATPPQGTAQQPTPPSSEPEPHNLPPLPLTIASLAPNAVVPVQLVSTIEGTAAPGSRVELRGQFLPSEKSTLGTPVAATELLLGVVTVDSDGRWQLTPQPAMQPGQYVLTARQLDEQDRVQAATSPVVITALAAGEEGPLSLTTPVVRFPAVGARLRSGPITFTGNGLPGMRVRIYLDSRELGETVVNSREEWRFASQETIPPGIYIVRAAALNPQGDILAESPPVAFLVFDAPLGQVQPTPGVVPARSLQLSDVAFGGKMLQSLVLSGIATPHAAVAAWAGDAPLWFVNSRIDGRWQIWLASDDWRARIDTLEVRTQHGERIAVAGHALMPAALESPDAPLLLSPHSGQVVTTRRPLVLGLAQPSSEVAVVVNSTLVARVLSDARGQWAFQLVEPLPSGQVALTATTQSGDSRSSAAPPVVITVAPQLSNGVPAPGES